MLRLQASRVILELHNRYQHNYGFASQVEDTWRDWATTAGGVTYSLEPLDQARILAHSLHRIIESLLDQEIPIHFLKFPRFAEDIEYLAPLGAESALPFAWRGDLPDGWTFQVTVRDSATAPCL